MVSLTFAIASQRTCFVQRSLNDDDVILLIDRYAVVGSALDIDTRLARSASAVAVTGAGVDDTHSSRHSDLDSGICLDCGNCEVQNRMAALGPHDAAREHHATEVAIIGVGDLHGGVAQDRDCRSMSGRVHLVLGVDRADVAMLPADRERDFRAAALPAATSRCSPCRPEGTHVASSRSPSCVLRPLPAAA